MEGYTSANKHLVLVGGGHTHVLVLRALGMRPVPGLAITLIAKEIEAPYSGMLPGFVAGHYSHTDIHVDVVRLAAWAGIRLIHGGVDGIDRRARRVSIAGRAPLAYDVLSIDIGITPRLDAIPGAAEHGLSVKPVSTFAARWRSLETAAMAAEGPRRFAVVGTGAAGFELVLAMRHRLLAGAAAAGLDATAFGFMLIGGRDLLPSHNPSARRIARREIIRAGVTLIETTRVADVGADGLRLEDGRRLPADAVLLATDAGPAPWFRACGLPVDARGFLAVKPSLQLLDDDDVFAVGDCATVVDHPREKAGVFAVRQGPPLTENIRRRLRGETARPFRPQRRFLTLLALGDKRAIAARNGLAVSGAWVWRWKDNIDRAFMDLFADLPRTGMTTGIDDEPPPCTGCGAKVGPVALSAALDRLGTQTVRDDAAVRDDGQESLCVETIDFLPAFWPEPYVFGAIVAEHAMNDIYAMGGRPERALSTAIVPFGHAKRTEEDLYQLLEGARSAFERAGVTLVGGHSGVGPHLAAGFFVAGRVPRDRVLRKSGLRTGDALIVTRAIGSGIVLAAYMRGVATAPAIVDALQAMRQSNATAAHLLIAHGASAMTDVTGFGLAGHLVEMIEASHVSAGIVLDRIPLYGSARALARAGIESTLAPENVHAARHACGDALSRAGTRALLFDPQTSGGLLAGIPAAKSSDCLAALHAAGYTDAACIGSVRVSEADGTSKLDVIGDFAEA